MINKRHLIAVLKYGVSLAIIAGLILYTRKNNPQVFNQLVAQPKHWGMFGLATLAVCAGVILTFLRWYLLVRALELKFSLKDAFRLGCLGYFCNFFSLGSVGGDLFKAVFIAREQPQRRAEAVATVVVDRLLGLYGLLVVATGAILATGLHQRNIPEVQVVCNATFLSTAVGAVFMFALLIPGFTTGALSEALGKLPKIGPTISKLITAVRMYRRRLWVVGVALVMSLGVHMLMAVGIYFVSRGLPLAAPDFAQHFVIVPLALVTGALPLPASGLGATEAALEFLYFHLPNFPVASGTGLMVALAYRLITIFIALIGACFYISARRDVQEVSEELEHSEQESLVDVMPTECTAS